MLTTSVRPVAEEFQLKETLARRHAVGRDSIILFNETGLFLSELFKSVSTAHSRIIAAAPAIADVALAADRAGTEFAECEPGELFAPDIDALKRKIRATSDIIYLANPNRLTGASYANSQLKTLASLVPEGLLIVDEYYHEFSQLTALPLLNKYQNLVVLRVFENWTKTGFSDCGYAIINEQLPEKLEFNSNLYRLERATAKKCLEIVDDKKSCETKVELIQKQALRVAKALSEIGFICQLAPADFILLELSNAGGTQNYLNGHNIRVERLGQGELSQNYWRCQISGNDQDNQIIEVFSRMPAKPLKTQTGVLRKPGVPVGSD